MYVIEWYWNLPPDTSSHKIYWTTKITHHFSNAFNFELLYTQNGWSNRIYAATLSLSKVQIAVCIIKIFAMFPILF